MSRFIKPWALLCLIALGMSRVQAAPPAELDWLALMPPEDQQALEQMPDITHTTQEAEGFSASQSKGLRQAPGLPQVMYSSKTVAALKGKVIRLGGYPVPLETNPQGKVTELFLVPYPGACIHVPPPPPNQIVWVRYKQGIALEDLYTPLWVDGTLEIQKTQHDLADSAYSLSATQIKIIDEEGL